MARTKRLYRAIAYYPDDTVTRHYQNKRARDLWAKQRLEGYPEQPGTTWEDEGWTAIPPAIRVELAESEPIIFAVDNVD